MKPTAAIRSFLALTGSSLLAISHTQADILYWDGATPAGAPGGGAGTWDTSLTNWDNTQSADSSTAWVNANLDLAVFGGTTAGTVTLGSNITVGGLRFDTNAYFISTGANTLSFGAGDNNILLNGNTAVDGTPVAATITGAVGGTGNTIFSFGAIQAFGSFQNLRAQGVVTLNGTSTTGWSGSTTVNAGMTLALADLNQGLVSTSGITLNGGHHNGTANNANLLLTNTSAQATLNRINDSAANTFNGGNITYTNTNTAAFNYSENIGSVELGRGQTNFVLTNNLNAAGSSQTLILSALTRTGATNTSVATFSANTTGPQASGGDNMIRVNGITTSTGAGQILGPWATTGVSATSQSDYAKYVSDGTNGFITAAGIAHSLEGTWTTAANSYTFNGATPKAAAVLSGTRNMTGLKVDTVSTATGAADAGTERVTWTSHGLVEGAPFVVSGTVTGGLTAGNLYYARNVTANDFQISSTPTGAIIDLTNTTTIAGLTPGILLSSGNNLGTTGILTTQGVTTAITATGTGVVTLPSTTSAALYATTAGPGASNLLISAPIVDNGAGKLTLVKSGVGGGSGGQGVLTLAGNNTFSGGLELNAGTVRITTAQSFTGGVILNGGSLGDSTTPLTAAALNNNAITVNGYAQIFAADTTAFSSSSSITINSTGALDIGASGTVTVNGAVSGTGTLLLNHGNTNAGSTVILASTANTFTGNVISSNYNGGARPLYVNSFGDGGKVTVGYNSANGPAIAKIFGLNSGAIAPLTFNTRQFEMVGSASNADNLALANNSNQAFTINTDLLISGALGNRTLTLQGTGAGLGTFAGKLENGSLTTLGLIKSEAGTWTVTNAANSFTGSTTINAGTLRVSTLANGGSNSNIGASTNAAGNLILNGGTLQYTGGTVSTDRLFSLQGSSTIDASGSGAVNFNNTGSMGFNGGTAAKTLTLTGTNTGDNTIAAVIGNNTGTTGITKSGPGTWVLSATNTYTGATAVSGGKLVLDYGTNNTSKLSDTTSALTLGATVSGGVFVPAILELKGGSHTEIVTSTTLAAGSASSVIRNGGSSILRMNAITFNAGATIDFGAASIASTSTANNAAGILNAGATIGGVDWATNSGTAEGGGPNNFITAYTAYTDLTRQSSGTKVIPNSATANVRIVEGSGGSPANLTLAAATTVISTLNQSISGGTGTATVALANQTLRTNAILMGPTAGTLTIGAAGGTAALSGTLTNATGAGGTLNFINNSASDMVINSVVADNTGTGYAKTGTGALVLAGNNTFNGALNIQDGIVKAGKDSVSNAVGPFGQANSSASIILTNKSTAGLDINGFDVSVKDLQGGGTLGGNVTLTTGKTLAIENPSSASAFYNGTISGGGNLVVRGSSRQTFNTSHTYTGTTTLIGSFLRVSFLADGGNASGLGQSTSDAGNLVFNGGSLEYNSISDGSTNRLFTLGSGGRIDVVSTGGMNFTATGAMAHSTTAAKTLTLTSAGTGNGSIALSISDSGTGANITSISKGVGGTTATTNTWSLTSASNTFTGAITLNTTTVSAGTLAYASSGGTNAITFNQTTGSATLSYIGSTDKTMSGAITASALTSGTITFDASGAGAVNYSNTASLGTAGSLNKNLVLSGTSTGNNTLAGGWNNNTGGAATITKNGASRWTLSGTNNYTGTTVVNAGTLQFARQVSLYNNTPASWTAANINVKSGATFAVNVDSAGTNGFTDTSLNTLLGNISVANTAAQGLQNGATLGFDTGTATGGTFTQGNAIANSTGINGGTIGLTKLGTGTLVLDKANTYTGATHVTAGKLLINGSTSTSSAVTVANGATLGGSGAIGGSVTVQAGGTFAPGSSIESIATGNLALLANAVFAQEIDKSVAANISGDLTATTGTLSITSGAILTLTELGTSGTWAAGDTITLIGYSTGTWNGGLFTYLGNTLNDDSTFTFSGINWTFDYNDLTAGDNYNSDLSSFTGSARYVTMTAVPEPRAALLGGIGLILLLRRRRA